VRARANVLYAEVVNLQKEHQDLEAVHPLAVEYYKAIVAAARKKKPRKKLMELREAFDTLTEEEVDAIRNPVADEAKQISDEYLAKIKKAQDELDRVCLEEGVDLKKLAQDFDKL
jgi:hypothetical protein